MLGGGGFGGPKRPLNPLDTLPKPSGPPTKSVEQQTDLRQAMIFRLTGDYNRVFGRVAADVLLANRKPLTAHHVDPVVTKENGYDKPILHGPCTVRAALSIFSLARARLLTNIHLTQK